MPAAIETSPLSPAETLPGTNLAPQLRPADRFYRPELDGLRFFSFLVVFISHAHLLQRDTFAGSSPLIAEAGLWLQSATHLGYAAVAVFFVLSSYLITELLFREHERTGKIDIPAFYARRALRIWPLYFFFLAIALVIEPRLGLPGLTNAQLPWYCAFLGNWQIVATQEIPRSATQLLWTVAIEEQFYLAWPLLIALVSPKRLGWICTGLLAAGTLARTYLCLTGASFYTIHFNTFTHFDAIAWGSLLAIANRAGWFQRWNFTARGLLCVGGLLLALVTQRYLAEPRNVPLWPLLAYPLFAIAGAAIVAGAMRSPQSHPGWLTNPWFVQWGKISYGLYIWHILAIFVVYGLGWCPARSPWTIVYALPVTFALATMSYHWIEQPFLRWKRQWSRVETSPPPIGSNPPAAET
jgi:peptidoglycan/LPS O-acetylase OafA/YrhL